MNLLKTTKHESGNRRVCQNEVTHINVSMNECKARNGSMKECQYERTCEWQYRNKGLPVQQNEEMSV